MALLTFEEVFKLRTLRLTRYPWTDNGQAGVAKQEDSSDTS